MDRGKLIVIEGSDGCGKETQSKLLKQKLENMGIDVIRMSFPTYGTDEAKLIEKYLSMPKDTPSNEIPSRMELAMYYAIDRAAIFRKNNIKEKIENGTLVICDRYVESNLIYQTIDIEDMDEVDEMVSYIETLEYEMLGLPYADKVFYLQVNREVSNKLLSNRESLDRNESNDEFMRKVDENGLMFANIEHWDIIDCNISSNELGILDPEEINKTIMQKIISSDEDE